MKEILFIATQTIPEGYTLIAASSHNEHFGIPILYCQNNESGQIFEYSVEGKRGSQIVIPDGYTLVAAATYGSYFGALTFYCRHNETGEIIICN